MSIVTGTKPRDRLEGKNTIITGAARYVGDALANVDLILCLDLVCLFFTGVKDLFCSLNVNVCVHCFDNT